MRLLQALAAVCLLVISTLSAMAQIPGGGGGVVIGAPIQGPCTSGDNIYSNSGFVGCQPNGAATPGGSPGQVQENVGGTSFGGFTLNIAPGCQVGGTAITPSNANVTLFTQDTPFTFTSNGSTPFLPTWCGGTIHIASLSDTTPALPGAGTTNYPIGVFWKICNDAVASAGGSVAQTLTPMSGTIGTVGNGASTWILAAATTTANSCVWLVSDGVSNWNVSFPPGGTVSAAAIITACGSPASGDLLENNAGSCAGVTRESVVSAANIVSGCGSPTSGFLLENNAGSCAGVAAASIAVTSLSCPGANAAVGVVSCGTNVQILSGTGTWTGQVGETWVRLFGCGPGGPGGSGGIETSGTAVSGGGGGGAGDCHTIELTAASLGGSATIAPSAAYSIPGATAGGAAKVATAAGTGNAGSAPANTTFGSPTIHTWFAGAPGGAGQLSVNAQGGGGGGPFAAGSGGAGACTSSGSTNSGTSSGSGTTTYTDCSTGGSGSTAANGGSSGFSGYSKNGASGGGAGAGFGTSPIGGGGGAGGFAMGCQQTAASAGGAAGASATQASQPFSYLPGCGGGGGGSCITNGCTAGSGAAASGPGGGGGGGGGALTSGSTTTSGAGGAGGAGIIVAVSGWLLKRDLDPSCNDNSPAFVGVAA